MAENKHELSYLHEQGNLSFSQQMGRVVRLAIPAILAEVSSIVMQYIDAAMVGSLGANASASIGLVASTTWLLSGLCMAFGTGFAVQIAHLIGAGLPERARNVLRQCLIVGAVFGAILLAVGASISRPLPVWLGGAPEIQSGATGYFMVFGLALPAVLTRHTCGGILQCSGDMRTPSLLNGIMCLWDVFFNSLLIFPTRVVTLGGWSMTVYGAGLGVTGAAIGTALAELVTALCMFYVLCVRSPVLKLSLSGSWKLEGSCLRTAAQIGLPLGLEHVVLCSAQIATTKIIAPLGTVAIAANSLGVTAESLCYMPGYGIGTASTTLVGQSLGAGRKDLARSFARLSVLLGIVFMSVGAVLMFVFAPQVFAMLTPDPAVQELGTLCLRVEAIAEPFYAASIVCAGAMRGAGDTMVPSITNLVSVWGIRITASILLAPRFGLIGVWIAMSGELCIRGVLFLIRLLREKWLNRELMQTA